ncbi:MAG: poly-gamma-glutamate biosynthesis protein PgsC [Sphaerochaetaceae bacterium]|nr:poly-gamma-glutamate biosynthesis protein PgsC [Spirochaetales bacterium]MDY5499472.1 poly-gamma-glutamate biosynthesis protein PgsC [Sphaerochaetaceae bacterium]
MNQVLLILSIVFGCLYTELTGLLTGGLVSAGYLSMHLSNPVRIATTVAVSFVTYLCVLGLSQLLIVYGRRRFVLCLLIGMVLSALPGMAPLSLDVRVIGLVVPGLIANDMVRQGPVKTLVALASLTCVLALVALILLHLEA